MTRFRPELHALEAREVPALNLFYNGADLLLTGTPTAVGTTASLRITGDGSDNFAVTDGTLNLGTYHVTRDIRVKLASFDTNVFVVLAGDSLSGNVAVDVGAGDTNPSTPSQVVLGNKAGAARVTGDVTIRGGSGQERYQVTASTGATLDVGGSVRVLGTPVATPIEDSFTLGNGATVRGDVTTSRITYTTISGTVNGDVTANTTDSPGGMGFEIAGTGVVHGDVTATGGATAAPLPDGTTFYSYANISGVVDGAVTVRVTSGRGEVGFFGSVGGDVHVTLPALGDSTTRHNVTTFGNIIGDTSIRSAGRLSVDLFSAFRDDLTIAATGPQASVRNYSLIEGDFRYTGGAGTSSDVQFGATVYRSVVVDLGGSAGNTARFLMTDGEYGGVGDLVSVKSRAGTTTVKIGFTDPYQTSGVIGGDLKVDLGDGANTFLFDGAAGSTLGGKLTYTGGRGTDSVTVSGRNMFAATIKTGAGNDTVAFAPDATVGSLAIDFGAGTDTWTPPSVIAFPVKLKRLP